MLGVSPTPNTPQTLCTKAFPAFMLGVDLNRIAMYQKRAIIELREFQGRKPGLSIAQTLGFLSPSPQILERILGFSATFLQVYPDLSWTLG